MANFGTVQPTDALVSDILIESATKKKLIDITDLVNAIDINESLTTPMLTGVMLIVDGAGLLTQLPLVGQEKITFKVTRGASPGRQGWTEEFTFYVRSIENLVRVNDFTFEYQIRIVQESFFWNALENISQSYEGTIDTIVQDIVTTNLRSEVDVEPTSGTFKCVIPSWNPYRALSWLTNRARTESNAPFYLYDTLFDGLQFRSIQTLFNRRPFENRKLYPHKEMVPRSIAESKAGSEIDLEDKIQMCISFESVKVTPTAELILDGAFGSTFTLLDTMTKIVDRKEWDYSAEFGSSTPFGTSTGTIQRIEMYKAASDKTRWEELPISGYKAAERIYAFSGQSFGTGSIMSYNEDALNCEPWRIARDRQLQNFVYKAVIPGDKYIQAGMMVELMLNKNVMHGKNAESEVLDKRRSGMHIITAVKHRFHLPKQQYVQTIEMARDSMKADHEHAN
tara:strand:+ start:3273 stop:4628 length:1356 start_codon:yes stop_codon:yes gene_type:complete